MTDWRTASAWAEKSLLMAVICCAWTMEVVVEQMRIAMIAGGIGSLIQLATASRLVWRYLRIWFHGWLLNTKRFRHLLGAGCGGDFR